MNNQFPVRVCTICVMDETDADIQFDGKGVCDHCNTFQNSILPNWPKGKVAQRKLDKLVAEIKKAGRGRDFDCIIGMSGGVDSSYLLHMAFQLGLRPLVFHVDAGWNSQIAVNNIERLVDALDLDLFTDVIDWTEMADLQRSFFKAGVPHIDTPQDHAFFATMYKFANKHNVKHILTGANFSTECIRNPINWMYYQSDVRQIRDIHNKFGSLKLNNFPLTSIFWYKVWLPYVRGIKVHAPLNLIDFNKKEAIELLQKNYGWQPYSQKHFESRFTKFYESYWLPERFGFDVRKVQFSSLILTGQMTREEAMKELLEKPFQDDTIHRDIEYVANKLGMTVDELLDLQNAPLKTYQDYRNFMGFYRFGAWAMKTMGLQRGGKR